MWLLDFKQSKIILQDKTPDKVDNQEDPKRDLHESTWECQKEKDS